MPESLDQPMGLKDIALLIPAWEPEPALTPLIHTLAAHNFGAIILIDDGSSPAAQPIFAALETLPGIHVLHHAINMGKGRALKTGFNFCLNNLPRIRGLVTADADGQHASADILRVAKTSASSSDAVVLGVRGFATGVPLRSRFGNTLTRYLFAFTTGTAVTDTQTGLRALPRNLLPSLLLLEGERYEYEMSVLAYICRRRKPIEVPIRTIYIDNNRSSHFDPIRDSMRIYFVLARFYVSSIAAAAIDFAGFAIAFVFTQNLLASMAFGRISSLVNFTLNRNFVFHDHASVQGTLWRYYALVAGVGTISYSLVFALHRLAGWNIFATKLLVDTLLSLVSFSMQRTFVFQKPED